MKKSAPLYSKEQVMVRTQTLRSKWRLRCQQGIIPPPVGREGNADRWSSAVIDAIANKMLLLGDEYSASHTIDILLDCLEATASKIQAFKD